MLMRTAAQLSILLLGISTVVATTAQHETVSFDCKSSVMLSTYVPPSIQNGLQQTVCALSCVYSLFLIACCAGRADGWRFHLGPVGSSPPAPGPPPPAPPPPAACSAEKLKTMFPVNATEQLDVRCKILLPPDFRRRS